MNVIGIGIAIFGVGLGLGLIGNAALQGMARQPEAMGKLQVNMLIALAFAELMGLLAIFMLPTGP
jgi:F-type H+-transporting ATPase subunit c